MLSVKLLFLDAIIENLTVLLCREDVPVFFDSYLSLLDRLIHARNALRMRWARVCFFNAVPSSEGAAFSFRQKVQISILCAFRPYRKYRAISGCFPQWFFRFRSDFISIAVSAFAHAIAAFLQSFIEMQQ